MTQKPTWKRAFGVLLICLFITSVVASACSIPVFRYALTRWRATPYMAVLAHEGSLSDPQKEVFEYLKEKSSQRDTPPNLRVRKLNLEDNPDARERLEVEDAPSLMLLHPSLPPDHRVVWRAPVKKESVDKMVESPVRKKLAQRLLDGHAAVWLLLESGNQEKDRQARKKLRRYLQRMEDMVRLPMGYQPPPDASIGGDDGNDKDVEFSLLRLDRSAPEEKALVSILLRSEPGLTKEKYSDEPMAFPVFGRGRMLNGLVGDGINEANVARASSFLVGGCQCQVKSAAPGKDLLLSADWSSVAYSSGPGGAPPSVQGALGGRGRSGRNGTNGTSR